MVDYSLFDLVDMKTIQKMAEAHFRVAGMPMGIIDAGDGSILVEAGWQDICLKFHRADPASLERCRKSEEYIRKHLVEGEAFRFKCMNGLWDIGVPIVVAGRHLARMFLGQFFYEGEIPDREFFTRQAREFGYDLDQYLTALDRVPIFSREKVECILDYNLALVSFISDLAEQALSKRKAEEAIREGELKLQAVFDNTYEFLGLMSVDGRLLKANRAALEFAGVEEADVLGKPFWECPWWEHSPQQQSEVRLAVQRAAGGEFVRFETTHRAADGDVHYIDFSLNPVLNEAGEVVLLVPESRDVTERRLEEEKLQFRNILLSTQQEASIDGILVVDENGRILSYNKRFVEMWGFPRELFESGDDELVLQFASSLSVDPEAFLQRVRRLYEQREGTGRDELLLADGRVFERYSAQMLGPAGRYYGRTWYFRDITESKRAEEALRYSEARLRQIIDLVPLMIFVKDWDGNFLLANRAVARAYNTSVAALTGENHRDFHPDADELQRMSRDDRQVMESGKTRFIAEESFTDSNGNVHSVQTSKVPFYPSGENIRAVLGVSIDVTEQLLARDALRESGERLSQILDFLPDPTFAIDLEGKVISWNRAVEEMTGLGARSILGKANYEYALPFYGERRPLLIDLVFQSNEEIREKYSFIQTDGDILIAEADVPVRGGEIRSLAGKARPLYDTNGKIIGAIESIRDVTGLKRTEEMLRESEERYRSVVENMQDVFYRTDRGGVITMVSPSASGLYGAPHEELLGKNIEALWMYPHERAEMLERMRRDGFVRDYEVTCRNWGGMPVNVAITSNYWKDRDGAIRGVEGIVHDMTERKQAEEERARLVRAIEQIAEGIIITDADWNIEYANPAFERISGYAGEEIVGRHIRVLNGGKHAKGFYEQVGEALLKGEAWSGHIKNRKKDGALYDAEITASAIRDSAGAIKNYVSIHRDVSRELQLEKELRQAQKMESLGTLAGGIAHDFNNMLFIIRGFTELAKRDAGEGSRISTKLDGVLKTAERATELVKQILAFSRRSEQQKIPLQLGAVIEEAMKILRASLPSTLEIRTELQSESTVLADPTQMHQVLMNLCTNAAHSMQDAGGVLEVGLADVLIGPEPEASLNVLPPGRYVELKVKDSGCGIDPSIMDSIYDPFFTSKGPGEGTGLGLSVVHGIVKSQGGTIDVESAPGKGTVFSVLMPVWENDRAYTRVLEDDISPVVHGRERVLVVDDEPLLAEMIQDMLDMLGYDAVLCSSAMEALEIFRLNRSEKPFDLVLTDMTMPDITGADLARMLFELQPDIPVMLTTGFSNEIDEEKARGMGIKGFLMKPLKMEQLATELRKVLEERTSQK